MFIINNIYLISTLTGIGGDDELVLLPELDVHQVHRSGLHVIISGEAVGAVDGEKLKVGHGGKKRVGHVAGRGERVEVESEVTLRRSVHCANQRKSTAVIV